MDLVHKIYGIALRLFWRIAAPGHPRGTGATFTNFTNVACGAGNDFGELGERGTQYVPLNPAR
jgi:hypothetical protein